MKEETKEGGEEGEARGKEGGGRKVKQDGRKEGGKEGKKERRKEGKKERRRKGRKSPTPQKPTPGPQAPLSRGREWAFSFLYSCSLCSNAAPPSESSMSGCGRGGARFAVPSFVPPPSGLL
jgi:hypothetical protein